MKWRINKDGLFVFFSQVLTSNQNLIVIDWGETKNFSSFTTSFRKREIKTREIKNHKNYWNIFMLRRF